MIRLVRFLNLWKSDLCKAIFLCITYQQSHYCSRLKLGLCDDTSLLHPFDYWVLLGNHDCSHSTEVIGTARRYDSNPLSPSLQSTCSVSGRPWVRIPKDAACDTDFSYADGDLVNIVEGAVITMPLLFCPTKAIAHLLYWFFLLDHQKLGPCKANVLCATLAPEPLLLQAQVGLVRTTLVLRTVLIGTLGQTNQHDSNFPIASLA